MEAVALELFCPISLFILYDIRQKNKEASKTY